MSERQFTDVPSVIETLFVFNLISGPLISLILKVHVCFVSLPLLSVAIIVAFCSLFNFLVSISPLTVNTGDGSKLSDTSK